MPTSLRLPSLLVLVLVASCGSAKSSTSPDLSTAMLTDLAADLNGLDLTAAPAAHLTLDRAPSFDFGTVVVNSHSATVSFVVRNDGNVDSGPLGAATLSGSDAGIFQLTDGCMGQPLAPTASCVIGVVLAPTAVGTPSATLSTSATPGGGVSVQLTGTVVTPGDLTITPSLQDFGGVASGGTSQRTLTFTNTGGAPTGVITTMITGSDENLFSVVSGGTCTIGQVLQPSATCTLVVQFAPTAIGNKEAGLTVLADPGGPGVATLTGMGLSPAALGFAAASYSGGTVLTGSTSTVTLTLNNNGMLDSGPLPNFTTSGDSSFSVTSGGTCVSGAPLSANASCTIVVQFAPASIGTKIGSLSVAASPGGTASTSLTGVGKHTFTLTVTKTGVGSGTLAIDGTACATFPCVVSYDVTTSAPTAQVTATATPVTSTFSGWSGDCTGSGACSPVMNANRTVQGNFDVKKYTVTVNLVNIRGASGGVSASGSPSGPALVCTATACTAQYNYGTTVTLTEAPTSNMLFQSWGTECASRFATTCGTGAIAADFTTSVTFRPKINYMFVTSDQTVTPQSIAGDLTVADKHCDALARAGGLYNTPTSGAAYFKALLATSGASAATRLAGAQGWIRPDGREFANLPADMFKTSGTNALQIFYPPEVTEIGTTVRNQLVTTGCDATGMVSANCGDYGPTGNIQQGAPGGGADIWVASQISVGCNVGAHLYCFETAQPPTLVAPPAAGVRNAFVSAGVLPGTAGISAFDNLCMTEASGHLSGTFAALLPTVKSPASARFTTGTAVWARPDGVLLGTSVANIMGWDVLAPLDQDASGNYLSHVSGSVWVGTAAPNLAAPTLDSDCNDWGATANATTGFYGYEAGASLSDAYHFIYGTACASKFHVYCLQQ